MTQHSALRTPHPAVSRQPSRLAPRAFRLGRWLRLAAAMALAVASMVPTVLPTAADDVTLTWTTSPGGGTINANLAPQGVLTTTDPAAGANHNGGAVAVALTLQASGGAAVPSGVTFTSTTPTCAAVTTCSFTASPPGDGPGGVATNFAGLQVNRAGAYQMRAAISSPNAASATSTAFTVKPAAAGDVLSLNTTSFTAPAINALFNPQPIVTLKDSAGNVIVNNASTVTAAITAGGVLTGATTVTMVNGVATFTSLAPATGGAYTLTFSTNATDLTNVTAVAAVTATASVTGIGGVLGTSYVISMTASGSPNPSATNAAVTITGTGTAAGTLAYTGGYMWFQDSGISNPICSPVAVTASGNQVTGTCTYNFPTTGPHTINGYFCGQFPTITAAGTYVIYQCTNTSLGYATNTYTQTVGVKNDTTTTLSASPTQPSPGQTVTFTATVAGPSGSGTATGTVDVKEGATTICTVTLSGGTGSCSTSTLTAGSHTFTASYVGDASFNASSSFQANLSVGAPAAVIPPGAAAPVPVLPASLVPPPNTNLGAIRQAVPFLADVPTADVVFDYFGPSRVVSMLTRPPRLTLPTTTGCWSGPNATAEEEAGAELHGTKSAGTEFILFFIRGSRSYVYDSSFGNYCWVDLT